MDDSQVVMECVERIRSHCQAGKLLVTFNGVGFDLPVILHRAMYQDIAIPAQMFRDLTKRYNPKNHCDLMQELAGWDMQRVRGKGLDFWLKRFGLGTSKGNMDGSKVYPAFKDGQMEKIVEYCLADVQQTARLFRRVAPFFFQTIPQFMVIDLETVPDETVPKDALPQFDPDSVALGNLKDADKIAAKISMAEVAFNESIPKKMSLDPDLCQVVCAGFYDSNTDRLTATFMEA